jgi:hypothetical protein
VTPDDPRHGTYAGSQYHTRTGTPECQPCILARRRYQKRLEIDHDRNIRRRVSPDLAARHINKLRNHGMSIPEIARHAGIPRGTVYRMIGAGSYPQSKYALATNVAKILAVQATPAARGYVPRLGVIRRIQALNAIGWPRTYIAERLGMSPQNLTQLVNGCRGTDPRPNDKVQAATWLKVDRLYRELHMTPGPSPESVRRARAKGYPPPLAWDDIDNPTERPVGVERRPQPLSLSEVDEARVLRLLAGERIASTRPEKDEAMRRWVASGKSEASLCAIHGWRDNRYGRAAS